MMVNKYIYMMMMNTCIKWWSLWWWCLVWTYAFGESYVHEYMVKSICWWVV